jgi:hypothetical protein
LTAAKWELLRAECGSENREAEGMGGERLTSR